VQLRDQWKRPRDWKVIAGASALAALGVTGLVLVNPVDGSVPEPISLEERARVDEASIPASLPPNGVIDLTDGRDDSDSPLAEGGISNRATGDEASTNAGESSPSTGGAGDDADDSPAAPTGGGADDTDDTPQAPRAGSGGEDDPDTSPGTGAGDTADGSMDS
jgi:hypothetical protein